MPESALVPPLTSQDVLRDYGWLRTCGTDRRGVSVNFHLVGQGDPGGVHREIGGDALLLYFVDITERLVQSTRRATLESGRLVHRNFEIVDLVSGGVGSYLSRGRTAMAAMRQVAEVQDRYFPERVQKIFIIAPKAFAIFWRLVRAFVPTATMQKMEVYGHSSSERERFLKDVSPLIDPTQLPTHLGGGGETVCGCGVVTVTIRTMIDAFGTDLLSVHFLLCRQDSDLAYSPFPHLSRSTVPRPWALARRHSSSRLRGERLAETCGRRRRGETHVASARTQASRTPFPGCHCSRLYLFCCFDGCCRVSRNNHNNNKSEVINFKLQSVLLF